MKTRKHLTPKMEMQMSIRALFFYMGASIAVFGVIVWLVFLNVAPHEDANAAGSNYGSNRTGNWTATSTWNGGNTPPTNLNGDNVTVNSGHTITLNSNLLAQNNTAITINGTGVLQVNGNLDIQNNLTLMVNGRLIVSGDILIKNGANITINGGGNVTTGGNVQLGNNANLSVDGSFNVGGALSFGNNSNFRGNGTVTVVENGCSQWRGPGTCNDNIVLPVELLHFDAKALSGKVILNWQTTNELNNNFYSLERSVDGIQYNFIASVRGNGTTKSISAYEYIDHDPVTGLSYYRLSQTDFDGSSKVFSPVAVHVISEAPSFKVYPNPVRGSFVNITFEKPVQAQIEIVDNRGNEVISESIDKSIHETQLALDNRFEPGVYYVKYKTEGSSQTVKLVKQ